MQILVSLLNRYKWYIAGFVFIVLAYIVYVDITNYKSEQKVIRDTNKSLEKLVKEKDTQIKDLQDQLDVLKKEQELKEKTITKYEYKRQSITEPKSIKELKQRFRGLGYAPIN
jgi:predicted Holliday junction resolvase-like endonuclease